MALFRFTRQAAGVVPCDQALLYDILTDYDTYSEWMPLVATSKLLAREGELAIAELHLTRPRQERLVIECIHTKNEMVLGRPIEGRIPVSKIEWHIAPAAEGRSQVTLQIESNTSWRLLTPGYRKFMNATRCLDALRSHLSAFAPELSLPDKEGEKILEIVETEDGVVVWLRGKKYTLKAGA